MKESELIRVIRLCDLKLINLIEIFWETVKLAEKAGEEKIKLGDETTYLRDTNPKGDGEQYRLIDETFFRTSLKIVSSKRGVGKEDQKTLLKAFSDANLIRKGGKKIAVSYKVSSGKLKAFIRIPMTVYEMLKTWENVCGKV